MNIRNSITTAVVTFATLAAGTAMAADAVVSATRPVYSNEIRAGMYFLAYDGKASLLEDEGNGGVVKIEFQSAGKAFASMGPVT